MRKIWVTLTLTLMTLGFAVGCRSTNLQPPLPPRVETPTTTHRGPILTSVRQFSLAGRRSGEGYFRRDGRHFIFQSERQQGNPFYQIYLTNLITGQTTRVSPGYGKTTCAWIHPTRDKVIFSSTHGDKNWRAKAKAEFDERLHPKSRYNWSFDENYDIYEADFQGRGLRNLTKSPGYDAESSYSPDGEWIAFASNRAAYTEPMSEADAKAFLRDPSYMMDLYIMKADGSNVRRLTKTPGYDGGPFFSPDGKRLTFRRFSPDGHTAEVYTIGVDGTDEKRITNMKAMSWAPFYHPTGDYLIFASNKYGHANFELFIVDVQGRRDPVRVTEWDGFDGLPVFTPDGRKLVWTHADKGTEGQLYEADFNDAEARELLSLPAATPVPAPIMAWIDYLTQPKFAGRMTGSPQEPEYLGTIAEHMAGIGLKPVGGNYMQAFEFTDGVRLGVKNQAQLKGSGTSTALPVDVDWIPTSDSKLGPTPEAQIVFAGYGIVAPSDQGQPAYDAYEGLDVKGRWALVFDGIPNEISNERRYHLNFYSRIAHKALAARQAGAIGLLVIDDANSSKPLALKFEGRGAQAALPILRLSPRIADQLLTFTGQSREDWTEKLSQGEVAGATVKAWMLKARVDLQFTRNRAHNVVGILRVPGATKSVVIGAHGDHLGQGQTGHSLAKGDQRGLAHPGADDNASGVAAVLSMAKDITQKYQARQITLRQNIVFAIWSGEEVGILGSTDFLQKNPVGPISAYINLDMVGRLRDHLIVQGVGSAQDWTTWLEPVAQRAPVSIKLQSDPYLPTDALSFYLKRIPAISFFTGAHPEYHTPADKPELINSAGLLAVAGVVQDLAVELAGEANPALRYQKVESTDRGNGGGRGFRLYLGTIPDYSSETQAGVKISGTSKNSPAEKAGLKPGDVIVELGGIKINTMNDYVYCLQALKADAPAKMRVLRAGAETTLEIVPKLAH